MVKRLWVSFLYLIVRGLISIRYRIRVRGLENLNAKTLSKKGGVLFLPNHPAEIDPVMLTMVLWKKFQAHPLVVENFYYLKGAHYLQTLVGAVPIPDLDGMVNKWKQKKIEKVFQFIAEKLKAGSNFLIYPAGRLKRSGEEVVGGASFVHNLVQECPEANIVLMRTTGLWGSRFSRALTGTTPSFGKVVIEAFKIVLKNLVFLTPRREVTIEVEPAPADFPYKSQRLEFNRYLESWFNMRGPEPLKLVSDLFWKESLPKVVTVSAQTGEWSIAPEVEKEIVEKIGVLARRSDITRSLHLSRDLGLDSLDLAQLSTFLEEKYEIPGLVPGELQTVEDVLKAASRTEKKAETSIPQKKWPIEESRPPILPPGGKTLQEAFLKCCDRMDNYVACADELMGVVSYRRIKMIALLLSYQIKKMEGDKIGILLPSSTLSYALIFATLLAKKTPVMLNWTVGVRAIDHSVAISGLKTVISSRRFLDHLNNGDLGCVDDILVLAEDIRATIPFKDKIRALYSTLIKYAGSILKDLDLTDISEDDPAVILFTSGTESLPKGVPLSHRNLISNQTAALSCVKFVPDDSLYCVLPPFHSFGLSVTGILPLMSGIKAYYAPDPTHNHAMSHDITNWKLTLFCCAPTFIKGLFRVSKPEELKTLRYVVGGAEKVTDDLYAYMEKVGGEMLEGYGITECGPIVTLTRPGKPRHGVGTPIPGVELCIVDESGQRLPPDQTGQDGEICILGPSVFHGYLDNPRNPFLELEGRKWYRSGDRGHIDADGSLVLSGRISRFMKIGGEMISIGGLEDELLRLAHEKKWVSEVKEGAHPLAVAIDEKESEKPLIILFTTFPVDKEVVNLALRECGYGRLIKIADVRILEQIPVTGTGKIHYRALDEIVQH